MAAPFPWDWSESRLNAASRVSLSNHEQHLQSLLAKAEAKAPKDQQTIGRLQPQLAASQALALDRPAFEMVLYGLSLGSGPIITIR